jgi:hypothetical protein
MANRSTKLIIKNSVIPSQTLPSSGILQGEGLVNLGDGILFFSGGTSGSPTWVPAGSSAPSSGYFEVGSNLYNLKIRNQITSYSGVTNLAGKFLSGTTSGFVLADITSIQGVDSYTTGGTFSNNTLTLRLNEGKPNVPVTGFTDYYTTGATLIGSVAYFKRNDDLSGYTLDLSSFVPSGDTYVTGFTYTSATNTIYLRQNEGQPDKSIYIDSLSGISLTNLTSGRVVYVGSGGALTDEAGFTYDDGNNKLTVGNLNVTNATSAATFGNGGVVIGSGGDFGNPGSGDLVVNGSLTVFGAAISAFTSDLYIEDNTITLNYNPTGSSASASLGAGWVIQDGSGGTDDVYFDIRGTGATLTQRGFATNLHDIFIRDTGTTSSPNGKRVLAEDDILDGGTY